MKPPKPDFKHGQRVWVVSRDENDRRCVAALMVVDVHWYTGVYPGGEGHWVVRLIQRGDEYGDDYYADNVYTTLAAAERAAALLALRGET